MAGLRKSKLEQSPIKVCIQNVNAAIRQSCFGGWRPSASEVHNNGLQPTLKRWRVFVSAEPRRYELNGHMKVLVIFMLLLFMSGCASTRSSDSSGDLAEDQSCLDECEVKLAEKR